MKISACVSPSSPEVAREEKRLQKKRKGRGVGIVTSLCITIETIHTPMDKTERV